MNNEELITHFYTCFKNKDYAGMQNCYAHNASFNDEVFKNLNAKQVKAMWQMLIINGKDLKLEFKNIVATNAIVTAHWDAYYTFSKTGKKVINKIDARFIIENGKIIEHTDSFNFYNWAKQALGVTGLLFGGTTFIKNKVKQSAASSLNSFMMKNKL